MTPKDIADLHKPMEMAMAMLEKTLQGVPGRIEALENVKADEVKIMAETLNKINGIMADIDKETAEINKAAKG
jgi:predicted  nucleic acid-binding Zn-ribbon protein